MKATTLFAVAVLSLANAAVAFAESPKSDAQQIAKDFVDLQGELEGNKQSTMDLQIQLFGIRIKSLQKEKADSKEIVASLEDRLWTERAQLAAEDKAIQDALGSGWAVFTSMFDGVSPVDHANRANAIRGEIMDLESRLARAEEISSYVDKKLDEASLERRTTQTLLLRAQIQSAAAR
jgi:hypothetical protein